MKLSCPMVVFVLIVFKLDASVAVSAKSKAVESLALIQFKISC